MSQDARSGKPDWKISLPVAVLVAAVWIYIRLVVYRDQVLPLTYVLPMLLCLWSRDRRQLVGMAAVFLAYGFVKHGYLSEAIADQTYVTTVLFTTIFNISLAWLVVDRAILLLDHLETRNIALAEAKAELEEKHRLLEESNQELEASYEELSAREEEISQQNEELHSQAEELAQQNEELQSMGEAMETQNEELRTTAEELKRLHAELVTREGLLNELLQASSTTDEERVLQTLCEKAAALCEVQGVAVIEATPSEFILKSHIGLDPDSFSTWNLDRSLAKIVSEEGRTASLEDSELRPDLSLPASDKGAIRSVLATPIRMGGEVMGALELYRIEAGSWSDSDFRLIQWAAGQGCLVLEAMRLRTQLEHANQGLEYQVEQRTAELSDANEQLQGFTYSVAHDFRQHIRGISLNASMLLEDLGDGLPHGDARDALDRLILAARKMSEMTDDLLSHARLWRQSVQAEMVDISSMAKEICEEWTRPEAPYEKCKCDIQPGIKVTGDPVMLRILLENLLDNAFKYSSGCEYPEVLVGMDGDGIFVKDNGVGINMSFSHKLFQPFERLHSNHEVEGTGIGLANVKRIIDRHGGEVWVESKEGSGTVVRFRLPSAEGALLS